MRIHRVTLLTLVTTLSQGMSAAEQLPVADAVPLTFSDGVEAILKSHCAKCHGAQKQESELRLTDPERLLAGGASGAVIEPGNPEESLLVHLIQRNSDPHMPPQGQLSEDEIARIEEWIRSLPADSAAVADRTHAAHEHWAFRTPVRPPVPRVSQRQWVRTPVDAFILSRLEKSGISPSPPAGAGRGCSSRSRGSRSRRSGTCPPQPWGLISVLAHETLIL